MEEIVRCRRALADAYYFHTAKRMLGTSVYQTLTNPPQTVALHSNHGSHGAAAGAAAGGARASRHAAGAGGTRRLFGAEYVVFSELTWAGRAVMQVC